MSDPKTWAKDPADYVRELASLRAELADTRAMMLKSKEEALLWIQAHDAVRAERDSLKAECASISAEFGLPPTIRPAEGEIARMRNGWKEARARLTTLEAETIERCAKVAEGPPLMPALAIAHAIRALLPAPQPYRESVRCPEPEKQNPCACLWPPGLGQVHGFACPLYSAAPKLPEREESDQSAGKVPERENAPQVERGCEHGSTCQIIGCSGPYRFPAPQVEKLEACEHPVERKITLGGQTLCADCFDSSATPAPSSKVEGECNCPRCRYCDDGIDDADCTCFSEHRSDCPRATPTKEGT
jgi:hypothetical protein